MSSSARARTKTSTASNLTPGNARTLSSISATYYYVAMLLSLLVFFGGANLAAHGFLRATSPHQLPITTCLPSHATKLLDSSAISSIERNCAKTEQRLQVRQGSFQMAQGGTMVVIAAVVFIWHLRRVRSLELLLR
jgi:hypothetical protein